MQHQHVSGSTFGLYCMASHTSLVTAVSLLCTLRVQQQPSSLQLSDSPLCEYGRRLLVSRDGCCAVLCCDKCSRYIYSRSAAFLCSHAVHCSAPPPHTHHQHHLSFLPVFIPLPLLPPPAAGLRLLSVCAADGDGVVVRLALLSLLAVFKDLLPGYRIRPVSEEEAGVSAICWAWFV